MLRPLMFACTLAVGVTAICVVAGDECSVETESVQGSAMLQVASTHLAHRTYDAKGRTVTLNGEAVTDWIVSYLDDEGRASAANADVDHKANDLKLMHLETIRTTKSQVEE